MTFQPSLELNAAFYQEIVEPTVRPVPHAAALLGWGSDVLGFDTARSTDHGWGPGCRSSSATTRSKTSAR